MKVSLATIAIVLIALIVGGGVGYYIRTYQESIEEPPEEVEGKTLNIAYSIEQRDMNNLAYAELRWNTYEGLSDLVRDQETGRPTPVPKLATSWDISEDGLVYTFQLREGVKFHDGTEFNATAVEFSYERPLHLKGISTPTNFLAIDDVTILGPYNVSVTLKAPNYFSLGLLFISGIVSPTYVLANAIGKNATNPNGDWGEAHMFDHECGTGPYKLKEWLSGERLTLEKFDDYWGGWEEQQNIDEIVVYQIAEQTTQKLLIEKGDMHLAYNIMPRDFESLNETGDVVVYLVPDTKKVHVALDTTEPPFDDVRVRKAIAYALDYEDMLKAEPFLTRRYGGVNWALYGENPRSDFIKYEQDLTEARALLMETGYLDSEGNPIETTSLTLAYLSGRPLHAKLAEIIKINLAPLGFDVTLEEVIIPLFIAYASDHSQYDMVVTQGGSYFETIGYMRNMMSEKGFLDFSDVPDDAEYEQLLDGAFEESDADTRLNMAYEASKIHFVDDVGDIALVGDVHYLCMRKEVQGWQGWVPRPVYREIKVPDLYLAD